MTLRRRSHGDGRGPPSLTGSALRRDPGYSEQGGFRLARRAIHGRAPDLSGRSLDGAFPEWGHLRQYLLRLPDGGCLWLGDPGSRRGLAPDNEIIRDRRQQPQQYMLRALRQPRWRGACRRTSSDVRDRAYTNREAPPVRRDQKWRFA